MKIKLVIMLLCLFAAPLLFAEEHRPSLETAPPMVENDMDLDQSPFFNEVDSNNDGYVTVPEWTASGMPEAMFDMFDPEKPGHATLSDFESRDPMQKLDTNSDGKISLDEVLAPMSGGRPEGPPGGTPPDRM
jgi:hypothetical protein